jgi:predicted DNA-binding transcriptional regulator AlpA
MKEETKEETFLTAKQLAARWNCCPHTIWRMSSLPRVKLGARLIRYKLSDIEAIESKSQK